MSVLDLACLLAYFLPCLLVEGFSRDERHMVVEWTHGPGDVGIPSCQMVVLASRPDPQVTMTSRFHPEELDTEAQPFGRLVLRHDWVLQHSA